MRDDATPILFIYASRDGHTRKIAQRMTDVLFAAGRQSLLFDVGAAQGARELLRQAPMLVLLAPVRYGYVVREMRSFIAKNRAAITDEKLALVNVNLTARKAHKNTPQTNPYMRKWLRKQKLTPAFAAAFGGCLDYPRYAFFDRLMIRLIMRLTGGPCDGRCTVDYTDWDRVESFALSLLQAENRQERVA